MFWFFWNYITVYVWWQCTNKIYSLSTIITQSYFITEYIHIHSFNGNFPGKPGLASYPWTFPFCCHWMYCIIHNFDNLSVCVSAGPINKPGPNFAEIVNKSGEGHCQQRFFEHHLQNNSEKFLSSPAGPGRARTPNGFWWISG